VIWGRVIDLFRRRRLDADLDAQLAYHLDALEAEFRAQGLAPDEARAAARRAMGGLAQVRDAYRDQTTTPMIDALWQDVRYGCRAMRHNLTFTAVVVLTLALGIGANTAVFSVLNGVLLKPLSYPQPEELVALRQIAPGAPGLTDGLNLSPSMHLTYAEQNRTLQSMGVWIVTRSTVTGWGTRKKSACSASAMGSSKRSTFRPPLAAGSWPATRKDPRGRSRPRSSNIRE